MIYEKGGKDECGGGVEGEGGINKKMVVKKLGMGFWVKRDEIVGMVREEELGVWMGEIRGMMGGGDDKKLGEWGDEFLGYFVGGVGGGEDVKKG